MAERPDPLIGPHTTVREAVLAYPGIEAVFELIADHEQALAMRFADFLTSKPNVRWLGPKTGAAALRTPTFSFTVKDRPAAEIPALLEPGKVAIGQGHFYAPRLLDALGIPSSEGVVRVSMVHYNTMEEVERLIEGLDAALG